VNFWKVAESTEDRDAAEQTSIEARLQLGPTRDDHVGYLDALRQVAGLQAIDDRAPLDRHLIPCLFHEGMGLDELSVERQAQLKDISL
jgi:hypothetical protein